MSSWAERAFLTDCGVDLSYGYWSDDINYWIKKRPDLAKWYHLI